VFVALETFAYWIVSPKEPAELSSLTRLVFPIPSQIIQLSLVERWEVVDGSSPLHRIVTGFATGLAACVPAFILPSAMLKLPAVIAHRKTVEN